MAMRNSDDVLKVLRLGHSFVRNLKSFISQNMPELNFNVKLDPKEVMIQFSGKSGASVDSLSACQLRDIDDFEPHLVILDIGTNNLAHPTIDPEQLASAMVQLVNTLIIFNATVTINQPKFCSGHCSACLGIIANFSVGNIWRFFIAQIGRNVNISGLFYSSHCSFTVIFTAL